jgi:hypothetical protein
MIIGIDVGASGALCFMSNEGDVLSYVAFDKLKDWKTEVPQIVETELAVYGESDLIKVGIEDVHSLFVSGKKENFNFGINKGVLIGIFNTLSLYHKIEVKLIHAKVWQNSVWGNEDKAFTQKGMTTKTDTKKTSLNCAQRLFPTENFLATARTRVPHNGIVDAILIAKHLTNL